MSSDIYTVPLRPSEYESNISSMCAGIEGNTTYVAGQLEDMFRCAKLGVDPWTGYMPNAAASASLVPFNQFNSPDISLLNMAGSFADGSQLNGAPGINYNAESQFVPIEMNTFTSAVVH